MKKIQLFLALLLCAGMVNAACDLSKCTDKANVEQCGEVYKMHGISKDEWMACSITCGNVGCHKQGLSLSFLSFLSIGATEWNNYDLDHNCYFDGNEVDAATADWGNDVISLEDWVEICNDWSNNVKNQNCVDPVETPICNQGCEAHDSCATSYKCISSNCVIWMATGSPDYCTCPQNVNRCGDAGCNCGETCSSCPTDCGQCPVTVQNCPNGAREQVEWDNNCVADNGCVGKKARVCTDGTWGGWSYCMTELNKCGSGSCLASCPATTTTTQKITTTTLICNEATGENCIVIATTTTTLEGQCISCGDIFPPKLSAWDQFWAALNNLIRFILSGGRTYSEN